ncbi:ATP-dependent DNA ligase [Echinicola pacifica]|uniref:DNA ligase (ATP) n=1 Tax=Echinicola pacifica TaxID=346377 RepID=A0A918PWV9_9BACT|nr:DNA ligase D [Echinicola pacifica]GGZ25598.1 ATP-dependent DNA ligase [Echinicola pacifica]
MALQEYNKKRDFSKTTEPYGEEAPDAGEWRFVVQRHDARKLHFDLRLEMDGVLKSWAVPKGPSLNPSDKRLAVHTEDHPLKYLHFQGTIPKGNYGAGEMTIWDTGSYSLSQGQQKSIQDLYKKGDLKLTFYGTKLRGDFALVKTHYQNKQNQWLLIKKEDDYSIDLDYDANLHLGENAPSAGKKSPLEVSPKRQVSPMLASRDKAIDIGTLKKGWLFEFKWDGYRILCNHEDSNTSLYSRNGISYTDLFTPITDSLSQLSFSAIIDGEVVSLNKNGLPQFQWLQHYREEPKGDLVYMVFDLLYLDGHSLTHMPLTERKELLRSLVEDLPHIRYSEHFTNGKGLYQEVLAEGGEGVIAKKADAAYHPGIRTESWLKFKPRESLEALICGYTASESRPFGSLILGLQNEGVLTYIGNCGTGFSHKRQKELLERFQALRIDSSPFLGKINLAGKQPIWMNPVLMAEVHYAEWTDSGRLRQPVFKALRQDKTPFELHIHSDTQSESSDRSDKQPGSAPGEENSLQLDGINVPISNLEKIYWPKEGIQKYDLIEYYLSIADILLPYLKGRPQNLHRHPEGIEKEGFYQKDTPDSFPKWIKTTAIYSESSDKQIDYMLCQDEATLIYMANLGCIEINPWHSKMGNLDRPDYMVIDIDPSPKNSFGEVVEVAQSFHEFLKSIGIEGYCKTSGSSGLHIYLPLDAQYTYEEARDFCKLICTMVQQNLPSLTTLERRIKSRGDRIYLDYLQNRPGQTIAAAYCVRPQPGAPVSTPLLWKEINSKLDKNDFTIYTINDRIKKHKDLFKGVLGKGIDIESALEKFPD